MKKTLLLSITLLLSACSDPETALHIDLLENPLYAERFSETMVNTMVELEIYNDPLIEDETKRRIAEETKEKWLAVAKTARKKQREGSNGNFLTMNEYAAGEVLYVENKVHFSTLFETEPGPELHVFLTTVVDPRDVAFPDETALDLGIVVTPFGAQSYGVPEVEDPKLYRTVVLWDTKLERLYGFAQISN